MGFEVIEVPELPTPGQFSHVVRKGNMVFISGQTANPEAEDGNLDPMAQAERVFGYIRSAVEAAGGDMSDIVKLTGMAPQVLRPALPGRDLHRGRFHGAARVDHGNRGHRHPRLGAGEPGTKQWPRKASCSSLIATPSTC